MFAHVFYAPRLPPLACRRYVAVMLDEAHERTIHTDVLFGLLKVRPEGCTHGVLRVRLIHSLGSCRAKEGQDFASSDGLCAVSISYDIILSISS